MNCRPSRSLPPLLTPDGWRWFPPNRRLCFWIGQDRSGTRWLVKCTGGFRSVRERAFSLIAQELGISCQSSTFLKLPQDCPPVIKHDACDPHQLAIVFLDEHDPEASCNNCPLEVLREHRQAEPYDVDVLKNSLVVNATDIARGQMLGMLCEMFEPPGRLFTRDHKFVQIGNELMFYRHAGANLLDLPWLWKNEKINPSGVSEAISLCERTLSLPDESFREALAMPPNYKPEMKWSLQKEIDEIRPRAKRFLQLVGRLS